MVIFPTKKQYPSNKKVQATSSMATQILAERSSLFDDLDGSTRHQNDTGKVNTLSTFPRNSMTPKQWANGSCVF
jgi:hypothetical protein